MNSMRFNRNCTGDIDGGRKRHIVPYSAYMKEVMAHLSAGIYVVTGSLVPSELSAFKRFPDKGKITCVWSLPCTTNKTELRFCLILVMNDLRQR